MFGNSKKKAADPAVEARKIEAAKRSFTEAIANTRPVAEPTSKPAFHI